MERTVIGLMERKVGEFGNKPNPPGLEDISPVVIGTAGGGNHSVFPRYD